MTVLTVGTARYIIITQEIALAPIRSDRPPVIMPPTGIYIIIHVHVYMYVFLCE